MCVGNVCAVHGCCFLFVCVVLSVLLLVDAWILKILVTAAAGSVFVAGVVTAIAVEEGDGDEGVEGDGR